MKRFGALCWSIAVVACILLCGCRSQSSDSPARRSTSSPAPAGDAAADGAPKPAAATQEADMASRAEALRMIERVGGFTAPGHPGPADTIWIVHLQKTKVADDQLRALAALKGLESLHLEDTQITDAGLKHVARLTNLHTLDLSRTKVTAKGLASLASLHTLYNLHLTGTQVRESDLPNLIGAKVLRAVLPFGQDVTKAWLTPGKLKAAEWATSKDGVLSLRLLVPETDIQASQPIVVLAELRNNTDKAVDVRRPLSPYTFGMAGRMDIRGPKGKVEHRELMLRMFRVGPGAFSTMSAGEVIRDRLDLDAKIFVGSDIPGEYEIVFTYDVSVSDQRAADRLVGIYFDSLKERFGKKNLWAGEICSQPITVTKVAQEKPAD